MTLSSTKPINQNQPISIESAYASNFQTIALAPQQSSSGVSTFIATKPISPKLAPKKQKAKAGIQFSPTKLTLPSYGYHTIITPNSLGGLRTGDTTNTIYTLILKRSELFHNL
jgi:hypothetical protein